MGMSVDEFAKRNGISRAQGWKEVSTRRVKAKRVGARTIIFKEAEADWQRALPEWNGPDAPAHTRPSQHQHKPLPKATVKDAADTQGRSNSPPAWMQETKPLTPK
jgi:hypothetical protein